MSSAHALPGLAAVIEARPAPGDCLQRVSWCCAVAVCSFCRWPFNPLEVPCGCPVCARCMRELGAEERARCLPCVSTEMQCAVKEPLERAIARVVERVWEGTAA